MANKSHDKPAASPDALRPRYYVYVRVPLLRGNFKDPPLIDWDASKDKVLWEVLSRNPKTSDIDWSELAERFDVNVEFILQQAAWLYQRHLTDMKLQMQKLGQSAIPQATPASTAASTAPIAEFSTRKEPTEKQLEATIDEDLLNPTPRLASRSRGNSLQQGRPLLGSRNTSTNTITQSKVDARSSPGKLGAVSSRGQPGTSTRQHQPAVRETLSRLSTRPRSSRTPSNSSSGDSSGDSFSKNAASRSQLGRSQMFRRAPRFSAAREGKERATNANAETDEDEEPTFFTFSKPEEGQQLDLGATLKHPQSQQSGARQAVEVTKITSASNTDSSVSSAATSAVPITFSRSTAGLDQRRPGPLSPHQRAQLAAASPHGRGPGGRSGSEGTPSMGSSFSDLDDFSGTQSALEDALMSQIQSGGGGSRISSLGDALRSRYGPGTTGR